MLFNSLQFLVFLPVVTLVHFALGNLAHRKLFLLGASYYFYAVWSIPLAGLLIVSSVFGYCCALLIERAATVRGKRLVLWLNIVANLGILFFFKYADFLTLSIGGALGFAPWPVLGLILPLGISFYTFQSMSYTIDVYRGDQPAHRRLLDVALYISFFPQLVAGPIMRAGDFLPQLSRPTRIDADRMTCGALLICAGLVKKVFLADPMGDVVDEVYGSYADFGWSALTIATYAFALQIYFDFSAYTDIALGAAAILGFRLVENFRSPYLAASIREFWRRWHISLSTWLRDYLYIPLGGSRHGAARTYTALMATMLLGGLWHGAAWTFVVWGALHGLYLAAERMTGASAVDSHRMPLPERVVKTVITFHLVCLAWIFFRAASFDQAFGIVRRIVTLAPGREISAAPVAVLAALLAYQFLRERWPDLGIAMLRDSMIPVRWYVYATLPLLVIAIGGATNPQFIYFQF
jgi:alginate O-acetyltransferase complex protein AlgI